MNKKVTNITATYGDTTRPNSWGSGLPTKLKYPTLTDKERTMIDRLDEPEDNIHEKGRSKAHRGEYTKLPEAQDKYYVPGEPIGLVAELSSAQKRRIEYQLGLRTRKGMRPITILTKDQVCWKYNIRLEWLEQVLSDTTKTHWRW